MARDRYDASAVKTVQEKLTPEQRIPSTDYFMAYAELNLPEVQDICTKLAGTIDVSRIKYGTVGFESDKIDLRMKIGERMEDVTFQFTAWIKDSKKLPKSTGIKTTAETIG